MLIYQVGNAAAAKSRLTWFDRSGKELGTYDVRENSIIDVRLSPDGRRVTYISGSPASAVWTLDLERKTKTRVTFDQQTASEPSWSSDGKTLVFSLEVAQGGGNAEIRGKAADGSGPERTMTSEVNNYHYPGLSPDGKYLTFLWGDGEKMTSLWIEPVAGNTKRVAIVQPPSAQFNISGYRVSPDGRWVAYVSDESGQNELYVTTFPEGKANGKCPPMVEHIPHGAGMAAKCSSII
jgi:Tol biopolymer transport system component